jgi:hypothetical protein
LSIFDNDESSLSKSGKTHLLENKPHRRHEKKENHFRSRRRRQDSNTNDQQIEQLWVARQRAHGAFNLAEALASQMAAFGRPPHRTEGSMLQHFQRCLRGVPSRLEESWKRFVHLFLDSVVQLFTSLVSFMPIASSMAFDEIVPWTCSLVEDIARQRKTWAKQTARPKCMDLTLILEVFLVRFGSSAIPNLKNISIRSGSGPRVAKTLI